jgi:hypothetical protein
MQVNKSRLARELALIVECAPIGAADRIRRAVEGGMRGKWYGTLDGPGCVCAAAAGVVDGTGRVTCLASDGSALADRVARHLPRRRVSFAELHVEDLLASALTDRDSLGLEHPLGRIIYMLLPCSESRPHLCQERV